MKKIIKTQNAPEPIGPYSQAVIAGNFLYSSGQIAIDPQSGKLVEGSVEEQAVVVLNNLTAVLKKAGLSAKNVVKATIYLKDMNDFVKVNQIYSDYFGESKPARSTVEVSRLPKDVLIEIDLIAIVD